jgi:hypothetical protein
MINNNILKNKGKLFLCFRLFVQDCNCLFDYR